MNRLPKNWYNKVKKSGGYAEVMFDFDVITFGDLFDCMTEIESEMYNPDYSLSCGEDTPEDLREVMEDVYDSEYDELEEMWEIYGDDFEIHNVSIVAREYIG